MLRRIALAVVIAAAVGIACLFLGYLLSSAKVPILETVGAFLRAWAWVIGLIAGAYQYLTGRVAL